jgi:ATP-dependent RNA helicase DDX49/DBP8
MSSLFGKSKRKRVATTKDEEEADQQSSSTISRREKEQFTQSLGSAEEVESSRKQNFNQFQSPWTKFEDLGLAEPLLAKCKSLGFKKPTPVQRTIIPYLLQEERAHLLALASTGSGKTAAFVLPMLHRLALDPYGIYAVILTPTRELAKQIHQQVLAFGSAYNVQATLVVGGLDAVRQSTELDKRPHFVVATPGRLAELLRAPNPPRLSQLRYLCLDEADRLLASGSGFERDVAELLIHCNHNRVGENRQPCQTLLFSATMTRSLESMEELAGGGKGKLRLQKFLIRDDGDAIQTKKKKSLKEVKAVKEKDGEEDDNEMDDKGDDVLVTDSNTESDDEAEALAPKIPEGLKQEYIFMPSRVRDAYLLTAIRKLMVNGGRVKKEKEPQFRKRGRKGNKSYKHEEKDLFEPLDDDYQKARLAIIFVSTCERAAMVSCILEEVGVDNVALHSLLSQNRRMAALGKFKSEQVRVLVATDVAR